MLSLTPLRFPKYEQTKKPRYGYERYITDCKRFMIARSDYKIKQITWSIIENPYPWELKEKERLSWRQWIEETHLSGAVFGTRRAALTALASELELHQLLDKQLP
jgi:hypothetical protein